jgi:YVTN family beta-propeller protein
MQRIILSTSLSFGISMLLLTSTFPVSGQESSNLSILSAPAGSRYTEINRNGTAVIPNGRLIAPFGKTYQVAPHPFGLAISNDGSIAVTANSGTSPLSISILTNLTGEPFIRQVPPGPSTDKGVLESVFMGVALTPDNKSVYVSGGQTNKIYRFDIATGAKLDSVNCAVNEDNQPSPDGYIGDMVLTKDGKYLYAVDQMLFRMIVIDTRQNKIVKTVPVGRYPFGIALSPDETKVYVANVGVFEYSKISNIEASKKYDKALKSAAFANNTKEMREGTVVNGMKVKGLGDPNVPESFSVWAIVINNISDAKVVAKIKTGNLVGTMVEGIPAVGGSSPNSLVATDQFVFVSNGNNDNISVIDIKKDVVVNEIFLKPHAAVRQFRGIIPFGLAISPDQKRLYVAESGINAIGVVDLPTFEVKGHIPAGWFPAKVKVTGDGKRLIVANAKGFGSGPNGGPQFKTGKEITYIGELMKGTVGVVDIPTDNQLKDLTAQVLTNNFRISTLAEVKAQRGQNPVPIFGGEKESPIKYIVFISKENRTYDEVFGQVKKGNGDSTLARYGRNVSFTNKKKTAGLKNVSVMVNHLKLAKTYAIADNFYVDSDVSADGHRWLVNTYPNEWVETTVPANYGGNREYRSNSKAPGALAMNGAAGAIYPEDYNEAGSMWEHLERNKIDFYNFGFSVMFEPAFYEESFTKTGIGLFANFPVPQPIFTRTSQMYPTYNTSIPDQFRINQFIKEFDQKFIGKGKSMPSMITCIIPNDHGAGEEAGKGYPFRESYMADNDLAVGRIIEYLSHTPYWKNMAVFITEDDAQNGVDHIDAHRSILMVASPYAKKDYVGKVHYSFGSIFKTFWNILGMPYLNQYDAGANDLSDLFTDKPDFTPYKASPVNEQIFDPAIALKPFNEKFNWKSLESNSVLDKPADMIEDQKEKPENRELNQKKE